MGVPKVSAIVPVYNCEVYLADLIKGFLGQEFRDYELLLIDDGSTDGSSALCDQLAAQDTRIRVIHQENGGVSRARNRGLDESCAEFIVFVDADDSIGPDYLADMVRAQRAIENSTEKTLIVADYQPFTENNGPEKRDYPTPFTMDFRTGEGMKAEYFRDLVFQVRIFPPYCKLYRRDVIEANHIRFREGMKSAEDFDFNIRYLSKMDQLVYIDSVQYNYRVGYKKYVPSNHGVLGESEIKSAHIMARGITDLAKRMGILDEIQSEIDLWAANKHYFNRLRMLFRKSDSVSTLERSRLYKELISDSVYYSAAHRGAPQLPKSATRFIAERFDSFFAWFLFYRIHNYDVERH